MSNSEPIVATNPNEEHANILRAKGSISVSAWELGWRLLLFRANLGFLEIQMTPRFSDWTDYLRRGVSVSPPTAYRYMDAAYFPRELTEQYGVEKMSDLKQITDLTAVDETPEQALALELPLVSGGTKPFKDMTADETAAAVRLMKQGEGAVKRAVASAANPAATELQQKADAAVAEWLPKERVVVRAKKDEVFLDVRSVPRSVARKVFLALASLFPEEPREVQASSHSVFK